MPAEARGWESLRDSAAQIRRALDDQGNGSDFSHPTLDDDGFPTIAHPDDTFQVVGQGGACVYRSATQLDDYPAGSTFSLG